MDLWGCPLCGEHHELEFHSYPPRWSIGSDGARQLIRVATILCQALRGTGRQSTKRILPEHLIPRSPLWGKKLAELLEGEMGAGSTEAACIALGCVDPRTARKHIRALRAAAGAKLPILAEVIAAAPSQSESPAFSPGTNLFVLLGLLWKCFLEGRRGLLGSTVAATLRPLLWLSPGLELFQLFHRSCIPISEPPL